MASWCWSHSVKVPAIFRMLIVIVLLAATASSPATCSGRDTEREFEGGEAYRTGEGMYWVLSLRGAWRQMGRQYGGLVGDELRQFYTEITADAAARGIDLDAQLENARLWAGELSLELNELMRGIAETSGLSEDGVLVLNAGIGVLSYVLLGGEPPSACSALATWGRCTPDGTLVIGRNWDIDRDGLQRYMKYLSVVAFNPDSGYGFANLHPLGNVYVETGMNEMGVFIELNNGAYSDPECVEGLEDTPSVMATALNRCGSAHEAAEYLAEVPANLSYILQVADSEECVSVERATFGARVRRTDHDGVLAAYNSFVPPYPDEWTGKVTDARPEAEDPRYSNLIRLAGSAEFFGRLDADGMMELMDIEIRDGGALHRGTVYQVVAVPETLTLWIRALGYSGWQQVYLGGLFRD